MAAVGDEQQVQVLGLVEPGAELVIQNAFGGAGAGCCEAAQQQDLILAVALAAGHAFGFLTAVAGIAEHHGVARFGGREQILPGR